MSFSTILQGNFGDEQLDTSIKPGNLVLGQLMALPDGRVYKLNKAGSNALSPGLLNTYLTTPTREDTNAVAASAGDKVITVTASAVSANDFEDGFLMIDAGTGIGELYPIASNTATDSGTIKVTLADPRGVNQDLAVGVCDYALYPSPYNAQVPCPPDAQQHAVGVANRTVTAGNYFWGQVAGPCAIKIDNQGAAGGLEFDEKWVMLSTNHTGNGMIDPSPASQTANTTGMQICGYLMNEGDVTDTECVMVNLHLL